jgi:hypothetical protein
MNLTPVAQPTTAVEIETLVATSGHEPMAVRIPGHLLVHVSSEIESALPECNWTFLIGGWSEPILASLPHSWQVQQLERELDAFRSLGIERFAGFVDEGWEQPLAILFRLVDLTTVFVRWREPMPEVPFVNDHLGDVVTIVPIGSSADPSVAHPTQDVASMDDALAQLDPKRGTIETDRTWAAMLDADPEPALLYRKMLRLAKRSKKGIPSEALEWLLAAQAAHWLEPGVDRTPAHAALISARRRIDQSKRRPDGWTRVSRHDWDADGHEEVQIENERLSMIIDPAEGMLTYLDHKPSEMPISYLPGEPPGHLARGLIADQPSRLTFHTFDTNEERGRGMVRATGSGFELTLTALESGLGFLYRLHPSVSFDRLGPELPIATSSTPRLRVDGGLWISVDSPLARSGHRFRLDTGRQQFLFALDQPGDLFLRPAPGGVVAWPNWPVLTAEYHLMLEIVD